MTFISLILSIKLHMNNLHIANSNFQEHVTWMFSSTSIALDIEKYERSVLYTLHVLALLPLVFLFLLFKVGDSFLSFQWTADSIR